MKLIKGANDFDGIVLGTSFLFKCKDTGMVWAMKFRTSHYIGKIYIEGAQVVRLPADGRPFIVNINKPTRTDAYWYFTIQELKVLFNEGHLAVVLL